MTGHDRTCIPVLTGCTVPYRVSSYLLGSDFVTIQQEESKGPPGVGRSGDFIYIPLPSSHLYGKGKHIRVYCNVLVVI